jgi:hypothetical protein
VIEPQPSITLPSSSHVVPEGIHRLSRMERPDRVHPALRENSVICRAALRLKQRVRVPGLGRINVLTGWYDIVVACQHDRDARFVKFGCVRGETFQPSQLIRKFGPRLRIAVRGVDRGDDDAIHCRLDVTALVVLRIAGQLATGQDRSSASEDRDPIPALLAAPHGLVSRISQGLGRKVRIGRFQFLQVHDVRRRRIQPSEEVRKPLSNVIDVEAGDLHQRSKCTTSRPGARPRAGATRRRGCVDSRVFLRPLPRRSSRRGAISVVAKSSFKSTPTMDEVVEEMFGLHRSMP